ncbi:MAG: putative PurR-regulated permease PerM [Pseudohongiellaceae bacterium]|jgi:predicted PurR-regulated permease PerM
MSEESAVDPTESGVTNIPRGVDDDSETTPVEWAVRIGILAVWTTWCFLILRPFLSLLLWGVVLAVAVNPLHKGLARRLGGRLKLAAVLQTLGLLLVVVGPAVAFGIVLVENVRSLATYLLGGVIEVPPPPAELVTWPIVGPALNEFWLLASENLGAALAKLGPEIQALGKWALGAAAWTGLDLLEFTGAILVAGVLVVSSPAGERLSHRIGRRLVGERGDELAAVAEDTLRGVARGVIGVALVQSFLAGLGLVAASVPLAGLWTLVALLLCILQLGPSLVLVPAVIYVFATGTALAGWLLLVWSVGVILLDNLLRPLFMGKNLGVPAPVIILGVLGGMLLSGIIGLFVGAVILALGYRMFSVWLSMHQQEQQDVL